MPNKKLEKETGLTKVHFSYSQIESCFDFNGIKAMNNTFYIKSETCFFKTQYSDYMLSKALSENVI